MSDDNGHSEGEREHYAEILGLPDDYSPDEREHDRLKKFHRNDNYLSNCCGYPINSLDLCIHCFKEAEPMTIEMEGDEW